MIRNVNKGLVRSVATTATISRLQGKVAVVTASTEGIGYAIAERLASEGAAVVVSSRKAENVARAVKELKEKGLNVEGIVCHVSNAEHRKNLFDFTDSKFGGLDILVSNAAVNPGVGPTLGMSEQMWDKIFEVNVKNSWQLAKDALPHLQKRRGGSILFVSSIIAYQPMQPLGMYGVSKTSLLGLMKAIAPEVASDNIRVNCVAPGVVPTKFASAITESKESTEAALQNVPMQRFGKASEIAATAAFLVSDDASYITGETIVVAGGQNAHL